MRDGAASIFVGLASLRPKPLAAILALTLLVGASVAAAATGLVGPRGVRFISEEVILRVVEPGRTLDVEGRYQLRNEGLLPLSMPIRFPIAPGGRAQVTKLEVNGQPLELEIDQRQIRFAVPLGARSTSILSVSYEQLVQERTGRYVTTTVRDWGRPLEEARFRLELPQGCRLGESTLPFDRTGSEVVLRPFWPERDVSFSWRCPETE